MMAAVLLLQARKLPLYQQNQIFNDFVRAQKQVSACTRFVPL